MRPRPRFIFATIFCLITIFLMVTLDLARTSAEIRLDSGDLRYCYFGVPLVYEQMPEPQRTRLLGLTSGSSVCRNVWHQCAVYPLPTTNNTDLMCRRFYLKLDAWIDVDRDLARAGIEEVGEYIITTRVRNGLPQSYPLMWPVSEGKDGRMQVRSDWRDDEMIQSYRQSISVIPPVP